MHNRSINLNWLFSLIAIVALIAISFVTVVYGMHWGFIIAAVPVTLLVMVVVIRNPYWGFMLIFGLNYFIIVLIRYLDVSGLSVMIDILVSFTFMSIIFNAIMPVKSEYGGAKIGNGLIFVALVWFLYSVLEILNPRALTGVWFLSRNLSSYLLVMTLLTFLSVKAYRNIGTIIMVLSVFTLIGLAKGLMQKFIGFDGPEMKFLNDGAYKTHLLMTGTRYFSFYASAGIFGAVMGQALVIFTILAVYVDNHWKRIYFGIVAAGALYGLLISGTRGALAVPMAGFGLFIILSGRIKIMVPAAVIFAMAYVFLAMTTIGQSNALIRRMRTAFDPNEPSLMVRKENQKILATYLSDKPFGEGLGLSGVEANSLSDRFTTTIPTDSWYVKIWVETGIVGLCLHIAILLYIITHGSLIVYFKIKNKQLKGILIALLCGVFGILASSYGNQVLGQYPVVLIVYMSMALVFMGPYFDKQIEPKNELKPI